MRVRTAAVRAANQGAAGYSAELVTCTNVVLPDPAIPRQTMQAFFLVLVLFTFAPPGVLGGRSAGAVCLGSEVKEKASVSIPSAILYLDWKWDQAEHAR